MTCKGLELIIYLFTFFTRPFLRPKTKFIEGIELGNEYDFEAQKTKGLAVVFESSEKTYFDEYLFRP